MKIKDAIFVVTGSASGIGRALVIDLIALGGKVICVDKNPTNLKGQFLEIKVDLSLETDVLIMVEQIFHKTSHIDCFVANAGFAYYEKLTRPNWTAVQHLLGTNFISPVTTCLELIHRQQSQFSFVFICSAMAWLPIPGYALYAGSKSALHSFVEAFQFDVPEYVHLMVVYPIATKTNFFDTGADIPWPFQTDKTVSQSIINGLIKKKRRVYPSLLFYYFLLINRIFPILGKIYQKVENTKRK